MATPIRPKVANEPRRLRLLFLIRQLGIGGAERQLAALVRGLDPARFEPTVATLYAGGGMWDDLASVSHVRLVSLDKGGRWDVAGFASRLVRLAREIRPDIVHGYMIPANELSVLAGRASGAKVVWGIRISDQDLSRYSRFRRTVHRAGVQLSRFPDLLVANSHAGRAAHIAQGYPSDRFVVIPNGIDIERFRPDADARLRWRAANGFAADDVIVALPARLDPMKDHPTFLAAAQRLAAQPRYDAVRFACIGVGDGKGGEAYGAELRAEAARLGVDGRVSWLDATKDVVSLYNGVDIVTSASAFGEGFPNVLGEAMACGTPCVAASSGDAAAVIGDAGVTVASRDPVALADGWERVLGLSAEERGALGARARERMAREFTIRRLVQRSSATFESLVRGDMSRVAEALPVPSVTD